MVPDEPGFSAPDPPSAAERKPDAGADVFVSYASQDAATANDVVELLESHGLRCWIAPRDVIPGSLYADGIARAISSARVFVLVLSGNALASPHVSREIERAASKRRPIITLRTDTAPLTPAFEYFLSESQWIDVGPAGVAGATNRLVDAVRRHRDAITAAGSSARPPTSEPPVRPAGPRRRRWIAAASAALALAIAVVIAVVHGGWRFRLGAPETAATQGAAQSATRPADPSIAVLPFVDMSEHKDQEYFADGMAEEVLDLLAKIPGIRVIARTSSFQFKGRSEDLRRVGDALGSAYVVEGSVRKSGERLRVTAQLIGVRDGSHLWSETYDENSGDVLQVQDRIAAGLVRALQVTIGADDLRSRQSLRSLEGYDLYLRGRHALDRGDRAGLEAAVDFFRQALARDPNSSLVHAWLASAYLGQGVGGYAGEQAFDDARSSAERARAADPRSEYAAGVLGTVHVIHDWDWGAAQRELDLALSLAPGNAQILHWHSVLPSALGRWDEALRDLHASLALDPVAPVAYFSLGRTEMRRGQWQAAEAALRRSLEIAPTHGYTHYYLAGALLGSGDAAGALHEYDLEPDDVARLVGRAAALHMLGRHAESDAALRELTPRATRDWPYGLACAHAARGEEAEALAWLERAYAARSEDLWTIKGEVLLRPLDGRPRLRAFLRKMQLPE